MSKYYVNDKEVFDALSSTKQKVNTKALLELLKERGVICSPKANREELIGRLNAFEFMYREIESISEKIETAPKKARYSTSTIKNANGANSDVIKEIYRDLKESRQSQNQDEVFNLTKQDDGSFQMKVDYTDVDLSKTFLKQKQPNNAEIFIEISGDDVVIKSPVKERSLEITKNLKDRILQKFKNSEPFDISLIDVTDPELRSKFFLSLIKKIDSLKFLTVKSVGVESRIFNPSTEQEESTYLSDSESESKDVDGFDEVPSEVGSETADEDDIAVAAEDIRQVFQASLIGNSITTTSEYRNLVQNGFFISHIIWDADSIEAKYRLRVGFDDPIRASKFNYDVIKKFNRKKTYDFNSTPSKIDSSERRQLFTKIESAALAAYNEIRKEIGDGEE